MLSLLCFFISTTNAFSQAIVEFRIQNTLRKTDKKIACKVYINESTKTLTLNSLNTSESFVIIYKGGGIHTVNFYINNKLQAEKTIYRRRDIESQNGVQIYTSKTGEIIITLSA